jgi:hypothetical protein
MMHSKEYSPFFLLTYVILRRPEQSINNEYPLRVKIRPPTPDEHRRVLEMWDETKMLRECHATAQEELAETNHIGCEVRSCSIDSPRWNSTDRRTPSCASTLRRGNFICGRSSRESIQFFNGLRHSHLKFDSHTKTHPLEIETRIEICPIWPFNDRNAPYRDDREKLQNTPHRRHSFCRYFPTPQHHLMFFTQTIYCQSHSEMFAPRDLTLTSTTV